MNLYKGRKVWHKTLGPMIIHSTRDAQHTIYAKLIRDLTETATLKDDFNNTISLQPVDVNFGPIWDLTTRNKVYQILASSCYPIKEAKLTPVQRKIKYLWNNSHWVKNNPSQAY